MLSQYLSLPVSPLIPGVRSSRNVNLLRVDHALFLHTKLRICAASSQVGDLDSLLESNELLMTR